MKNKKLFWIILFTIILAACSKNDDIPENNFPLETADNIDSEEYEVYSAILVNQSSNYLVVMQKTTTTISISENNSYYQSVKSMISESDTIIFNNYYEKNDSASYLGANFSAKSKTIKLISSSQIENYFNSSEDVNEGWNNFYDAFPESNGFIQVSRVGFNTEKDIAIVELGKYYASLGADGYIIVLKKNNGNWEIEDTIHTWVS